VTFGYYEVWLFLPDIQLFLLLLKRADASSLTAWDTKRQACCAQLNPRSRMPALCVCHAIPVIIVGGEPSQAKAKIA